MTSARSLWADYSNRAAASLRYASELGGLDAEALRASAPTGRAPMLFACSEVPDTVRIAFMQLLLEETLVVTHHTQVCVTAVASVDRRRVLRVLPNIAAQILAALTSGSERNDTDCSVALDVFWMYGQRHLLDLVLAPMLALDDWTLTRSAEWFVNSHEMVHLDRVSDGERQRFIESADARPYYSKLVRDPALVGAYRPLWEAWSAAEHATAMAGRQIVHSAPDDVVSYALDNAAESDRYVLARLIADHLRSGAGRSIARIAKLIGPDFVPTWLPHLLCVAARRCRGAAGLYRELRRLFDAMKRPDLVEDVINAESRVYGRHDNQDRLILVRRGK